MRAIVGGRGVCRKLFLKNKNVIASLVETAYQFDVKCVEVAGKIQYEEVSTGDGLS